jgi:hypothetical protein
MGKIKNFLGWISEGGGKSGSKDSISQQTLKLKLFVKRLTRQVNKMEVQSKLFRNKAIKCRESGDIEGSKQNMKFSLQYNKWAHSTESFRVKLEGIQYRLEQAKAVKDFSGVAQDVVKILNGLQDEVSAPEITNLLKDMDAQFQNVDNVMETASESMELMDAASPNAVAESEVENALAEIDAEISVKRGIDLPTAPIADSGNQIGDLEEEIKKLKQQRT